VSRARRRFGQHFLTDRAVVERVVAAFAPAPGQRIVEIGPGRGALTDALVAQIESAGGAAPAALTAVEIDRDLAKYLQHRHPRITVINADILDFDLRDVPPAGDGDGDGGGDGDGDGDGAGDGDGDGDGAGDGDGDGDGAGNGVDNPRLRLIGNLPYNISTPLIFHLLAQIERIADMQFMLQAEVARRLCAGPGGKNYGRLSVMAALKLDCAPLFEVPPAAFTPRPKVDSTVLRLTPKARPYQARDPRRLEAVVAAAFGQRRKTVRNALAGVAGPEHFNRAGIDPSLRAEKLSVADYIQLADALG